KEIYFWTTGYDRQFDFMKSVSTSKKFMLNSALQLVSVDYDNDHTIVIAEIGKTYNETSKNFKPPTKFVSVDCGWGIRRHTIILTESGDMYGRGNNCHGQLGLGPGDADPYKSLQKLPMEGVKSVSCGGYHTIILTKNECFGCGANSCGQLGLGDTLIRYAFHKIHLPNIISVVSGIYHTIALTTDGLYAWGLNDSGQLGLKNLPRSSKPQKIDSQKYFTSSQIVSIKCGENHTIVLTERGELFAWGDNYFGQLCLPDYRYLYAEEPIKCHFEEFVVSVDCGDNYTVVRTKYGKYYGWGCNKHGQLSPGGGDTQPIPVNISCTPKKAEVEPPNNTIWNILSQVIIAIEYYGTGLF
ncbi:MAG TPA: hypothetical protein VKR58_10480, partial [Aquella sp.]|nr:hypothetical protein [Aquella sp.]